MPDRQLSILKIHSSRLKDQKYNLTIPYDEAKLSGEIVNLANNQILRTICEIKNRIIDFNEINRLYEERGAARYRKGCISVREKIHQSALTREQKN